MWIAIAIYLLGTGLVLSLCKAASMADNAAEGFQVERISA